MLTKIRQLARRATSYVIGHPSGPEKAWERGWVWAPPTSSGVDVNEWTALNYSAVWDAIRLISEGIASLPFHKFNEGSDGKKSADRTSVMAWWFRDQPNPAMTPMLFVEALVRSAVSWGNGYAEIERNGRGEPLWVWPLRPDWMRVQIRDDGLPAYLYTRPGFDTVAIAREDMIHVPGPSFDGINGLSPIAVARESIGSALAAERYGGAFYGNNSQPAGILKHKGVMTPEKHRQTIEAWERNYKGAGNAGKIAVLGIDTDWQALGLPQKDAQFIESRAFSVVEIARWFNVPPHKLKDLSRATFSNIEQQNIDWVSGSLRPWMVRVEQEFDRKTIRRGGGFWRFNPDALLRGDTLSRYQAHQTGIINGILTIDEARELEDRMPHPDGIGNRPLFPANTMFLDGESGPGVDDEPDDPPADPMPPVESEPEPEAETELEPDDDARGYDPDRVVAEFAPLFQMTIDRSWNRESKATEAAKRKHGKGIMAWAEPFHTREQAGILTEWLTPVVVALGVRTGRDNTSPRPVAAEIARLHGIAALTALQAGMAEYVQADAGARYAKLAIMALEEQNHA